MNIKDYFNIALANMFRNKKNKFYIFIMFFCSLLLLVMIIFMYNFRNLYTDTIQKNIAFKSLNVSPNVDVDYFEENKETLKLKWNEYLEESYNNTIQDFLNIKHVQEAYKQEYRVFYTDSSSFKNDKLDGRIGLLYGSPSSLPKVVKGRTFEENEKNVAICPINFYPGTLESNDLGIPKVDKSYMIDGEKILGTTFTFTYDTYGNYLTGTGESTNSVEIVGLYNSEKTMNSYAECYIPVDDIIEITHKKNMNNINNDENDDGSLGYSYGGIYVIVDEVKHVEEVISSIEKLGYHVSAGAEMDSTLVSMINISSIVITIVVLFAIFILTSSYIRKKIINESKTIGTLRTCGYTKKDIKKIYIIETGLTNMFSYIIALIIFLIAFFIFKETQSYMGLVYLGVTISTNFLIFLVPLIIILVCSALIVNFNISKKLKSDIVLLVESEE